MRRLTALVLVIALTSCGDGEGNSPDATEPVEGPTSTSEQTASDETPPPTTTTIPPPTTTTIRPPQATAPPSTATLAGNWARFPLVVYDDWGGMALGWWDGDDWIRVEEGTALPVSGGESYQVALLGSDAVLEGSAPTNTGCEVVLPEGLPGVQLSDGDALYTVVDDGTGGERSVSGVAISAPWDIHPRPAVAGEWHPDLEVLALDLLRDRGYSTDSVRNVQAVDADLEGDGALETLFVVEETRLANSGSDVYSMVLAVSPTFDGVHVVAESVIPPGEEGYPASFRVSAVSDLSGDGVMEVVVDGLAWETSWVSVYELVDAGFVERLSAGCGV